MSKANAFGQKKTPARGPAEASGASPFGVRPFAPPKVEVKGGGERDLLGEYAQRRALAATVQQVQGPIPTIQMKKYATKDGGLTVDVDAGSGGCYATASAGAKEYEQSSLAYALNRYMDGNDPPNTIATNVPMATQTDTMHSYPEQRGIGTLIAYYAMRYLGSQGMQYFQPDQAMSHGGKLMYAMISGTKRSANYMAELIAQADGGQVDDDDGCCSCFGFGSKKKKQPTEKSGLLQGIATYPAIEVDFETTEANLKSKVESKFDAVD